MTLNVAIVGAGNISRAHLSALTHSAAARVVGLYDADPARADQRAKEFGIERIYATWEALLGDANARVVAVLVPPDLHHRFSVEALQAGKDVVCEKPMASDLAECDAMLAAARRAERRLFIVQNRIYSPAYERAKELIDHGAIGRVFLAQSNGFEGPDTVFRTTWLATGRRGNGVLLAQAVHPAYALRWLLGDVAQVSCTFGGRKVVEMVEEDTAIATLRFTSGVLAQLTATFGLANGPFDHQINVYGDEGYLEIRNRSGNPRQPQTLRAISPRQFGDKEVHPVELPDGPEHGSTFRSMWEDYLPAIESGQPARVSATDGRRAVEIILAAHRANELNCSVMLPLSR